MDNTCVNDGNYPEYMLYDQSWYLSLTLQDCCQRFYHWKLDECLGDDYDVYVGSAGNALLAAGASLSTDGGSTTMSAGDGPSSGGAMIISAGFGTVTIGSGASTSASGGDIPLTVGSVEKWYPNWTADTCVQDCEGASPCGGAAESWDDLYSSRDQCCSMRFSWNKDKCMGNTPTPTIRSANPTSAPSISSQPSDEPSSIPSLSSSPSGDPTSAPSISSAPSYQPSALPSISTQPSGEPTASPSLSRSPSANPTTTPTISSAPMDQPISSSSVAIDPRPIAESSTATLSATTMRPTVKPTPRPTIHVCQDQLENVFCQGEDACAMVPDLNLIHREGACNGFEACRNVRNFISSCSCSGDQACVNNNGNIGNQSWYVYRCKRLPHLYRDLNSCLTPLSFAAFMFHHIAMAQELVRLMAFLSEINLGT